MIWVQMKILQADTTTDRLGNVVETGTYTTIAEAVGRFSPWSDEDVTIQGRDVTENQQRYLVPIDFSAVKDATHVEINQKVVEIYQITDNLPRWTVFQVRKWRS